MTSETRNWEFKSEEAGVIEIATECGPITVISEDSAIKAEIAGEYNENKCEVKAEIEDRILKLSVKTKKKWLGIFGNSNCKTGFKVSAPKDKKLILKSGTGFIKVNDFVSGGKFLSGASTVEFENLSGPITAKSGAGTVRGNIYSEEVDMKSGAGTIDLKWNKAPERGNVSIKSGAGRAVLSFPKETKMKTLYKSGVGRFNSEFDNDPEAEFKVNCKTGAGSLNIKKV